MKTADGQDMSGMPIGTPGSAEGTEDINDQSKTPPSAHTPGSAEGGALDEGALSDDTDDLGPNQDNTPMGAE